MVAGNLDPAETFPAIMAIYNLVQSSSFTASIWFEVILMAERYLAVCKPLQVALISTKGRVRRAVIAVWVSSVIFSIPRCFDSLSMYGTTYFLHVTVHSLGMIYRAFSAHLSYIVTYYIILRFVVILFVPFCLLTFFTAKILSTLRESQLVKNQLAATMTDKQRRSQSSEHRRTTTTLVLLVIISQLLNFSQLCHGYVFRLATSIKATLPFREVTTKTSTASV
jgi:hypothetical protein